MSDTHEGFAETMKQDWARAAQKELNGEDPFQKLSFTDGDLSFLPYYDATDLPTSLPRSDIKPGKVWVNAPKVTVVNVHEANGLALEHLQAGADGILFELMDPELAMDDLLRGLKLPFCSVFFYGNVSAQFLRHFAQYADAHGGAGQARGAVYGLSSQDVKAVSDSLTRLEQFTLFGHVQEEPTSDAGALTRWLSNLTDQLSALDSQPQLRDAAILIPLSDNLFEEVIRLRAIELLWWCLCDAYKKKDAKLFLHAWSKPTVLKGGEPHANMISSVSRAVSAILGGAHAISIEPQENNSFQSRIARNISFILDEESQLARVANSVEGSYFIESASTALAEEAWRRFQVEKR